MSDFLENIAVVDANEHVLGEMQLPQHVVEYGQKKGHITLAAVNGCGNFPPKFTFLLRRIRSKMVLVAPEGFTKTPVHKLPNAFAPKGA
jgi:hypothetical protein